MKRIIYLLAFTTLLLGCSEDVIENPTQTDVITRSAGDGKYDLLGYGYDVTGDYFTTQSAKSKVIDLDAFEREHADRIDYNAASSTYGRLTIGTSAEDYTSNLTTHSSLSPGFKLFSGSLEMNFEGSQHYSAKYSIADYSLFIKRKQWYLTAPTELLSQYLTNTFKEDINTQSPEYIIKNYGTHVLTNITLGARPTIMYRSLVTNSQKAETVKAGCNFSIMKVFGIDVGGSYNETLLKNGIACFNLA